MQSPKNVWQKALVLVRNCAQHKGATCCRVEDAMWLEQSVGCAFDLMPPLRTAQQPQQSHSRRKRRSRTIVRAWPVALTRSRMCLFNVPDRLARRECRSLQGWK